MQITVYEISELNSVKSHQQRDGFRGANTLFIEKYVAIIQGAVRLFRKKRKLPAPFSLQTAFQP